MDTVDELTNELERAEWNAIDALEYWRSVARQLPEGIPARWDMLRALSIVLRTLNAYTDKGDDNCKDARLLSNAYDAGRRLVVAEREASVRRMVWGRSGCACIKLADQAWLVVSDDSMFAPRRYTLHERGRDAETLERDEAQAVVAAYLNGGES